MELNPNILFENYDALSDEEIFDRFNMLFNHYKKFPLPIHTVENDSKIIRLTTLSANEGEFPSKKRYSYASDIKYIANYGRCNRIFQPIFYGAINYKGDNKGEADTARIVCASETIYSFRDIAANDKKDVYFSGWIVKEPMNLFLIFSPEKSSPTSEFFEFKGNEYIKSNAISDRDYLNFIEFIFLKFSTSISDDNNIYRLTSAISNVIYNECDGIIYPSVQMQKMGVSIAVKPSIIDKKIGFVKCMKSTFIKNGENARIEDYHLGIYNSDADSIEWSKIADPTFP